MRKKSLPRLYTAWLVIISNAIHDVKSQTTVTTFPWTLPSTTTGPTPKVSTTTEPTSKVTSTTFPWTLPSTTTGPTPKASTTTGPTPMVTTTQFPWTLLSTTTERATEVTTRQFPSTLPSTTTELPTTEVTTRQFPSTLLSTTSKPTTEVSTTTEPTTEVTTRQFPSTLPSTTTQLPTTEVTTRQFPSTLLSTTTEPTTEVSTTTEPTNKITTTLFPRTLLSTTTKPTTKISTTAVSTTISTDAATSDSASTTIVSTIAAPTTTSMDAATSDSASTTVVSSTIAASTTIPMVKPRVTKINVEIETNNDGVSVVTSISCKSDGFPKPNYNITHDGIVLSSGNVSTISKRQLSATGTYECIAWNKLGRDSALKTLSVVCNEVTDNDLMVWHIAVASLAGIIIGILLSYVVSCSRRRWCSNKKPERNFDSQRDGVDTTYQELDLTKLNTEDNYQSLRANTVASRSNDVANEDDSTYTQLSKIRDEENTYQSLT